VTAPNAAAELIRLMEAGPNWAQLPMNEQIALRAIVRRVAAIASTGRTTPEDWQQLAGFADWAGKPPQGHTLNLTVAGAWLEWHGGAPPADHVRVDVQHRNGNVVKGQRAGAIHWANNGGRFDVIAYRVVD
jgi:hypothetical protein